MHAVPEESRRLHPQGSLASMASAAPTLAVPEESRRLHAQGSLASMASAATVAVNYPEDLAVPPVPPVPARYKGKRSMEEDVEKGRHLQEKQAPPPRNSDLIEWDGPDDPENPQKWPRSKKWISTTLLSTLTFCVTFSSSVFSTATRVTAIQFGVSDEVMILGTSLFVLGIAVGPIVWGPMSELYGRKMPMFFGVAVFAIFQIPVAVAQNLQTIMLGRFMGGLFGCAPLAIVGGALADMWDPVDRGVAICTFAGATFIGPVAGPIAGSFITQSYLGWRWTAWLTLIMTTGFGLLAVAVIPESYAPIILSQRAKKIRFETKNWAVHAAHDETNVDMHAIVNSYLLKPVVMLFTEPILLLMTLYIALVYGILYLFFEAFPIAFSEKRGWSPGIASLPFLSITIGVLLGASIIIYMTKTRFARKMKKHGRVIPEERLPPMIIGAVMLPVGLFWFAWTSDKNLPWAPQVVSGIPIGAGVLIIFMQGLSYIIDVYLRYANSAIAGNTLVRSMLGAGFPLFATAMYNKLGVAWATSLLGFLTVAMVPVPILFYIYGKNIRSWSKMSMNKA